MNPPRATSLMKLPLSLLSPSPPPSHFKITITFILTLSFRRIRASNKGRTASKTLLAPLPYYYTLKELEPRSKHSVWCYQLNYNRLKLSLLLLPYYYLQKLQKLLLSTNFIDLEGVQAAMEALNGVDTRLTAATENNEVGRMEN